MGTKTKTRFTVTIEDQTAELFSIRELGDKSLNITLPHPINHEDPNRGNVPIRREYVSVHLSPSSLVGGTTIKRRTLLEDGREITYAALVKQSKERLIWPILFARATNLNEPRYAARIRPKDKVVHVCSFDAQRYSFLYCILLTRNGESLWEPPDFGVFTLVSQPFHLFTIWVYYSFVMLPSDPTGDHILIATNAPRIDGAPTFHMESDGSESLATDDVEPYIRAAFRQLRITLYERRIAGLSSPNEVQRAQLEMLCSNLVKVGPI